MENSSDMLPHVMDILSRLPGRSLKVKELIENVNEIYKENEYEMPICMNCAVEKAIKTGRDIGILLVIEGHVRIPYGYTYNPEHKSMIIQTSMNREYKKTLESVAMRKFSERDAPALHSQPIRLRI